MGRERPTSYRPRQQQPPAAAPIAPDEQEPDEEEGEEETHGEVMASSDDRRGLTVGDVKDEIRQHFDDAGLIEEQRLAKQIDTMARVRIGWLRLMENYALDAFAEGLERSELERLISDLDRFIAWLQQVRERAVAAQRPRVVR